MLNRVSEGNIDPMFQKLQEIFNKAMNKDKKMRHAYYEAYARNYIVLAISQQQQMNQLLSVNCVFVAALHRLCGAPFFAKVLQRMMSAFEENHTKMVSELDEDGKEVAVMRVKNIMNCLVHLFLFQSIGSDLLFDVIKFMLASFTESDIEVLIFVLHNIGLQLRKKDPVSIKAILDLFAQKRNSFQA